MRSVVARYFTPLTTMMNSCAKSVGSYTQQAMYSQEDHSDAMGLLSFPLKVNQTEVPQHLGPRRPVLRDCVYRG